MIALDTNVLVRYVVEDDARQSARAAAVVDRAIGAGEALFVSDVVLCEFVWVLGGSYRVPRVTIVVTLRELLRAKHLAFSATDRLARAVAAFEGGKGDFADYVIREHALAARCDHVVTFDRSLLRDPGFAAPA